MRKTCEGAGNSWLVSTFVFCIPHQTMLGRLDGRDMWHTLERREMLKNFWWEILEERDHVNTYTWFGG